MTEDLTSLTLAEIEGVEKLTMRWVCQALVDFGPEAYSVFLQSPDKPNDIAEDITREVLERLAGHNIQQRIFGTVDYKRARYIILPDQVIRQALFIDSKAEKDSPLTATMQMSQLSMRVRHMRGGRPVDELGLLEWMVQPGGRQFLTTTMLLHFYYEEAGGGHQLQHITVAGVPNGRLQEVYNPNADDTIWRSGRNAPSLGEDFRVRLKFEALREKRPWRVQVVRYYPPASCVFEWQE